MRSTGGEFTGIPHIATVSRAHLPRFYSSIGFTLWSGRKGRSQPQSGSSDLGNNGDFAGTVLARPGRGPPRPGSQGQLDCAARYAMTTGPALEVIGLRCVALGSVSFLVAAGSSVAIRGASGSGKTMLLRAIADLDPNEGEVRFGGRSRATIPAPQWRRMVGYLPAEAGWWADRVGEHLADRSAALLLLQELGLSGDVASWPVSRLSTGERARVALVRALGVFPKVLLLDEPTSALDPDAIARVESLVRRRVEAGLTVLWVTHDIAQAARVSDRLLIVENGHVREGEASCRAT
jgi:phosphate-transporting ATPase